MFSAFFGFFEGAKFATHQTGVYGLYDLLEYRCTYFVQFGVFTYGQHVNRLELRVMQPDGGHETVFLTTNQGRELKYRTRS